MWSNLLSTKHLSEETIKLYSNQSCLFNELLPINFNLIIWSKENTIKCVFKDNELSKIDTHCGSQGKKIVYSNRKFWRN